MHQDIGPERVRSAAGQTPRLQHLEVTAEPFSAGSQGAGCRCLEAVVICLALGEGHPTPGDSCPHHKTDPVMV